MNVKQEIKNMFISHLYLSLDEVVPKATIVDDLGADSLDLVELLFAAEEKFNIFISDEEAEKIVTVGDAIEFIEGKT